jgi:hypothetical protein
VNAPSLISVNSGSVCEGSSFTLAPTGASSYTISGGSAVVNPSVTSSYTIQGSNGTGCLTNTTLVTVTVYQRPSITVNSGSICSGQSFVMSPSGASSYSFSSGSATVSPGSTTSYSVTGFSAQGCSSGTAAVAVVNVGSVSAVSVNSGTICSGAVFTLVPSGAASYSFSGGSATVSPAQTTTYAVTGAGASGCAGTSAAVATVVVNQSPVISASNGSICPGSSFTIAPSGASTYTFSNGSAVVSPTASASYSVSGTSAQGCVSSSPAVVFVTITNNAAIAVNSGTICKGFSFTMTPSGASSYTFSSGSPVVTPAITTTYAVTGSNGQGCTGTAVSTVVVTNPSQLSLAGGKICQGETFTLRPEGADSYTYSSGTSDVRPEITTTYTVLGTKNSGCLTNSMVVAQVVVNQLPVVSAKGGSICAGQEFSIVASGAKKYTYSSGSSVVKPATSTSYTVSGQDVNGCVSNPPAVIMVEVAASPSLEVSAATSSICAGGTTTLYAKGADTYNWNGGEKLAAILTSPAKTTTYVVTGWSNNGCYSKAEVVVNVENCTGISESSGNNVISLSAYPNPSNGEFTLELGENAEVSILTIAGVKLRSSAMYMGKNAMSITDLQTGIYIIKVQSGDKVQSLKVIKQ